ncbi:uncharacterized protein LOC112900176 [Panicum hallii]|uniref:uncharacterized protein LOC112900176 n=1 Tax=Panicum hallii TaxID=206008 RepID=UPI000DF4D33C|nr:uncharacterized protein LOC112900176 [Panicum hallii]
MQTLSDGNYRSCAILGGSVEVPADCGGRRGECGRGRPRETCGARRQHVGDVRKQRSADLESGDSDGGRGREGEAFVHLCGEVGREKCVGSQTRKWRWSTRLTHRSRSRSRSRSTDWPSVLEQQRLRRGMDHVINYAFQACSSNEERQSLEAATNASVAQQWMQSNPQFTMSQQVPPYFTTTPSPQQTPLQPSVQRFTEEQRPVATASTGKKAFVNTGQRKEGFWFRITQAYNAARGIQPQRSQKSLMNHWDYIKEYCMKFADFYTEILRINPSGMSDADKTTEALARYAAAM